MKNKDFTKSFTLVEVLVVVGILIILLAASIPAFQFFKKGSDLDNTAEEIINTLRLAESETLASKGSSQYGVYFATSSSPQQYILYKGVSYGARDVQFDKIYSLPKSVSISEIDFSGSEVVFEKITGQATQYGNIVLRLENDYSKIRNIYIERSGQIGLNSSAVILDENRIKDSRHVWVDYNRIINFSTERIVLTFEDGTVKIIAMADNLINDQIFWEGEITVSGGTQKIKIHTLRLNSPDTQFSIHRDGRYNNKALRIDIDDTPDLDPGSLLEYSADGLTTTSTSSYVTNLLWQ